MPSVYCFVLCMCVFFLQVLFMLTQIKSVIYLNERIRRIRWWWWSCVFNVYSFILLKFCCWWLRFIFFIEIEISTIIPGWRNFTRNRLSKQIYQNIRVWFFTGINYSLMFGKYNLGILKISTQPELFFSILIISASKSWIRFII